MEKTTKILIGIIIVVILSIIVITIILLNINKQQQLEQDNPETVAFEDIEEVKNKPLFYQVDKNINTYMNYLIENNVAAIKAISPSEKHILKAKYTKNNFLTQELYALDKISNNTFFVYGVQRYQNVQDDYYFVVNFDYENNTFSIIVSTKQEFEDAKNNTFNTSYKQDIQIAKNEYNGIEESDIIDFGILKRYFEDYKFKAMNQPDIAFNLIDPEYKLSKFNNDLENYKLYIKENLNTFQDANIVQHGITMEGQYGIYVAIDNFNNYYKIKEMGINQYTIILDNYTLESDTLKEAYSKLSVQEKVLTNVDKIMKLINTKSYGQLYSYLNSGFKNNYFATVDIFQKYIENNFFENNIVGKISLKNEGNYYIATVPYKESLSTAARANKATFIIKLGTEMNFEFSFQMQ